MVLQDGDGDQRWLASRLRQYIADAPRGLSMEMAFDLAPMPGEVSWWTQEAAQARDLAIWEMAVHFWPERKPGAQAREIERLALRYEVSAWRFDRERVDMPERYAGTKTEHLWQAFKSGAAMPLGWRQLVNILTAEKQDTAA